MINRISLLSITACTYLILAVTATVSSDPSVEKRYFSSNNSGGINTSGRNNKVMIICPKGFIENVGKDPNSVIVGTFKTINKNPISQWRGIKRFEFKKNGLYSFYEKEKLVSSGEYRVGIDPLRKGNRKVAVLESAGPLWVRIDSKNRINYEYMNYDRVR